MRPLPAFCWLFFNLNMPGSGTFFIPDLVLNSEFWILDSRFLLRFADLHTAIAPFNGKSHDGTSLSLLGSYVENLWTLFVLPGVFLSTLV